MPNFFSILIVILFFMTTSYIDTRYYLAYTLYQKNLFQFLLWYSEEINKYNLDSNKKDKKISYISQTYFFREYKKVKKLIKKNPFCFINEILDVLAIEEKNKKEIAKIFEKIAYFYEYEHISDTMKGYCIIRVAVSIFENLTEEEVKNFLE